MQMLQLKIAIRTNQKDLLRKTGNIDLCRNRLIITRSLYVSDKYKTKIDIGNITFRYFAKLRQCQMSDLRFKSTVNNTEKSVSSYGIKKQITAKIKRPRAQII